MFRIGRDFRGLYIYEDNGSIGTAAGAAIIVPVFMLIAPPALILLFLWTLGILGIILGAAMSIVTFVAFWLSKRTTGLKKAVIYSWYNAIICAVYAGSIVYCVYERGDWGFLTWVAMGICGMTLLIVSLSINDGAVIAVIMWLSVILTWLFSMAIVYGIEHGRRLPEYIYLTVAAPIALEFIIALLQTLRLAFSPSKWRD